MELRDYIHIVRRSWVLILLTALVGLGASVGLAFATQPIYTANTSVFVTIQSSNTSSGSDLNAGTTYVQSQVKSFAQVATTESVLQPVIDELGLDTNVQSLAKRVTATAPLDTVIIEISVSDPDAERAAKIANATGASLISTVTELSKPATGTSPVKMSTVSPALVPDTATSPNVKLDLVLGLLIGLVLGIAFAVLRTALDTRVHSAREVALVTTATLLGGIIFDPEAKDRPLVVQMNPKSPRAEAFRQLRTNLQFVEVADGGRTFIVTSSVPSEGKSSTSVNLAITLAEAGAKVLLIDGDLRRPKVAQYMGIEGAVGLTDHLIGLAELDDVIQPWGSANLHVLPAGQVPPNPSELLGSKGMIALLARLDSEFDTVIIDAPPLLPVTDAAILATLVSGGAMMVVGSGKISKNQLDAAVATLETAGARLVGVIVNLLPVKSASAYGYYGYYGYSSDTAGPAKKVSSGRRSKANA